MPSDADEATGHNGQPGAPTDAAPGVTREATSRTLVTERGTLHYHEAGEGPPLLMLHGSGPGVSGWANFGDNLPAFAAHFRTLMLDFPGFGQSYACERSPLFAAAPAVADFLDGLGLDAVSIVGNSMGGNIGARIAAASPERVTALVTVGGVGMSLFTPGPAEGVKLLVQFVEDPTRERLVAWMESMVHDPAVITEELVEMRWVAAQEPNVLTDVAKMFNRKVLEAMRSPWASAADQVAVLTKVEAPTLLTFGRDDRVTPLDSVLMPMRLIRNAEVHVFPNCGHWAMIERKAEFEDVVVGYLRRVLSGRS